MEKNLEIIKKHMAEFAKDHDVELEEFGDAYGVEYPDIALIFIEINDTYDKPFVAGSEDLHYPAEDREDFDTIEEAIDWCENTWGYIEENN